MKLIWKVISNVISFVLFALMICLAFVVISSKASGGDPTVMGYQFKSVLSGSMEPTFLTGSIIAIEPTKDGSKYQKGDVITFKEKDEKIITHRIIGVKDTNGKVMYETKGDNNNGPDLEPVLADNVIGKICRYYSSLCRVCIKIMRIQKAGAAFTSYYSRNLFTRLFSDYYF